MKFKSKASKYSDAYIAMIEDEVNNFCDFFEKVEFAFNTNPNCYMYIDFMNTEYSEYDYEYVMNKRVKCDFLFLLKIVNYMTDDNLFSYISELHYENICRLKMPIDLLLIDLEDILNADYYNRVKRLISIISNCSFCCVLDTVKSNKSENRYYHRTDMYKKLKNMEEGVNCE